MLPSHLPDPELYVPGSGEPPLRWGIIGPGWIAGEFAKALRTHTAQRLVAVSSRSAERSASFAAEHGIELALGSAEQLVTHPDVDVVYVATPPSEHLPIGLAAIAAGKQVLIEKPITTSAAEARTLADAARAAGVLVMEAMWSRYLPQTSVIRRLLADGVLGEVRAVLADHGQAITADPQHRLYRPDLGGGALLDLGIYPVQFSSMVLGAPTRVTAVGGMTKTGVDAYSTLVLSHEGEAQATLYSSILARTPMTAVIAGSEATISIDGSFYAPTSFTLSGTDHLAADLRWSDPTGLRRFDGLSWEATALARFAGEGRIESPVHTLEETVSILTTIDDARARIAASRLEGSHP
ncbi:GFO/IDH/MocA family oxidoreductase [Amycolatopsis mediterranei S699]|uniref:GFO/IDH/MocA family oxidoreductase n=2 Tax=Amycolatopsis mediterranei TaxID=33910 RepID=A0A0H3DDF8_AMYMU|nr:Gfo/Idh/MocA family oxidoreductase [Amycolatopsis mediterranei]ADJ48970.1 GFO/IDH/MocA family oxidoreductase [Amycolatopsis mediterranei U32]AEK45919.1 GFO/IDH/MocA family oxidoreductase [Amycolatopsis mediterranei S699]AFO80678.1 GFO/IDH/MocA family oxidoreductase [Amycolatopsis mediterranei S699]AGT87806.1 GFO/IDH/MocA family oxidoreductase [Amycolatopsis mediterranei RB]KDU93912.1 oxidoreductase [Amycolatopsis mediterranei]